MMKFVLKMMNFVLKMMIFVFQMAAREEARRRMRGARRLQPGIYAERKCHLLTDLKCHLLTDLNEPQSAPVVPRSRAVISAYRRDCHHDPD